MILKTTAVIGAGVAMITDSRTGKIPNLLTFPLMFIGLVLNGWWFGLEGLGYSFGAMLLGIAFYMPFAMVGAFGMGDVKLMAAIGALGGFRFVIGAFLYTSVIGIPHVLVVQYLNYGKDALLILLTSFTTGAYKKKTIHTDNLEAKYHFYLGIDIFLGTLASLLVPIPLLW